MSTREREPALETLRSVRLETAAISPEATVGQVARALDAHSLCYLPVIDADRRLVGVVTPRTLHAALTPESDQSEMTSCREADGATLLSDDLTGIANAPVTPYLEVVETHSLDTTVARAARILHEAHADALAVTDESGRFVGTLSVQRLHAHLLNHDVPGESHELVCVCGHRADEHHTLGLCPCNVDECECHSYEALADVQV